MLEERQGTTLLARYDLGDELLRMDRGGASSYYLHDGHGSTRQLTNAAGTLTDTYSYDAFGKPTRTGGAATATLNPFLFTGQQFDPASGLYFLRARYWKAPPE